MPVLRLPVHDGSLGHNVCHAALMLATPAMRAAKLKVGAVKRPEATLASTAEWKTLLKALLILIDGGGTEGLPAKFLFTVVVRGRDGETRGGTKRA